jgi:hypothetical protein
MFSSTVAEYGLRIGRNGWKRRCLPLLEPYVDRFRGVNADFGSGAAGRFDIALRSVAGSFLMLAIASRKFFPY